MKPFDLDSLVRKNIKNLKPYSSARTEYSGSASVFLDANENSFGSPLPENYNRYPDPLQWKLKEDLSKIKGIPPQNIFIGNGSDEVIDLAYRIFCNPGKDNVIICPPTYGMYSVSGHINDVAIKEVLLTPDFQLKVDDILNAIDINSRLLFICSPNNPTGNNMNRKDVETLINNFPGLVIIDEAYINFSRQKTFIAELTEYENLVVMQTLSKAWGLAALRLGLCFASEIIIDLFNKVKPPYNINEASQQLGAEALANIEEVNEKIHITVQERNMLERQLSQFDFISKIYPSDANFILAKTNNADKLYQYLSGEKIIVRNRTKEPLCENCLRITVGTPAENKTLLEALKNYKDE
ncbi:MAG: histidinol-phosphate transaminase [Ginsengibacter sp.]